MLQKEWKFWGKKLEGMKLVDYGGEDEQISILF